MPVRNKLKLNRYEYEENVEYANYYLLKKEINEQIESTRLEWQADIEAALGTIESEFSRIVNLSESNAEVVE